MRPCAALLVILALRSVPAAAQASAAPLARADAAVSIGSFWANRTPPGDLSSDWSVTHFKGISTGFYFTDHLKAEVEVGVPGETTDYRFQSVRLPTGQFTSTSELHRFSDTKLALGAVYQFGRNATFHPFLSGGVELDREREIIEQYTYTGTGASARTEATERRVKTAPFGGVGFKAYFTQRAFFRAEARLLAARREQLTWKIGLGVDLPSGGRQAQRPAALKTPSAAAPRGQESPAFWHRYAQQIETGSVVDVVVAGGERFSGTLIGAGDTAIVIKPGLRVPEAAREVAYDRIEQLALHVRAPGATRVGASVVGSAVGVGTFMALLMMALMHLD